MGTDFPDGPRIDVHESTLGSVINLGPSTVLAFILGSSLIFFEGSGLGILLIMSGLEYPFILRSSLIFFCRVSSWACIYS